MLDQFMQNVGDLRQNGWCHFRAKPVLVKNEYISGFQNNLGVLRIFFERNQSFCPPVRTSKSRCGNLRLGVLNVVKQNTIM